MNRHVVVMDVPMCLYVCLTLCACSSTRLGKKAIHESKIRTYIYILISPLRHACVANDDERLRMCDAYVLLITRSRSRRVYPHSSCESCSAVGMSPTILCPQEVSLSLSVRVSHSFGKQLIMNEERARRSPTQFSRCMERR